MFSTYFPDEVVDVIYQSNDADRTCKNWLKEARKRLESAATRAKNGQSQRRNEIWRKIIKKKKTNHEAKENERDVDEHQESDKESDV